MFQFGIDRLVSEKKLQESLHGKKVALLAHPASVTSNVEHSLDALLKIPAITITSCFGPQHGMKGEKQDNMVESQDYLDPIAKVPVFSLYGEVRRPTDQMMASFDVILIDLQDVGTRIYTFLTTLLYILEAAAKHNKQVIVLDRPNPAGRVVEGSLLKQGWTSFVGAGPLPMRHGLTLGEAGFWFIKKFKLKVNYEVIKMRDYRIKSGPGFGWPSDQVSWVNPSPNAASVNMARCFPGTVMIEGTNLSEARGTTRPLEMFGAPDLDQRKLLNWMSNTSADWLKGCVLRPCYFQPTFHKHADKICEGIQIHTDYPGYQQDQFKPYRIIALWFKAIRHFYPEYKIWREFHYEYEKDRLAIDLINGGPFLREWVDSKSATIKDFDSFVTADEKLWTEERKEFLLY